MKLTGCLYYIITIRLVNVIRLSQSPVSFPLSINRIKYIIAFKHLRIRRISFNTSSYSSLLVFSYCITNTFSYSAYMSEYDAFPPRFFNAFIVLSKIVISKLLIFYLTFSITQVLPTGFQDLVQHLNHSANKASR